MASTLINRKQALAVRRSDQVGKSSAHVHFFIKHAALRIDDGNAAVEHVAIGLREYVAAVGDHAVAIPREVAGRFAEAGSAVELYREILGR